MSQKLKERFIRGATAGLLIGLSLGLFVGACSDDNDPIAIDGGQEADSTTPAGDAGSDATPGSASDSGGPMAGEQNCGELAVCSDECVADCGSSGGLACKAVCPATCQENGCASAVEIFKEVVACTSLNCIFPCSTGTDKECDECVELKCSDKVSDCMKHSC